MVCRYATVNINVKVFSFCFFEPITKMNIPISKEVQISVLKGTETGIKLLYDRLFQLEKVKCNKPLKEDCVAAVPDWWQTRLGADRPQMTVQYSKQKPPGSTAYQPPMYLISIPHPIPGLQIKDISLLPYQKGQIMGVLTLKDNSKLIVNCLSSEEVERVINELTGLIDPEYLTGLAPKVGKRGGKNLDQITVEPKIIKLFSTGQSNLLPDDIHYI